MSRIVRMIFTFTLVIVLIIVPVYAEEMNEREESVPVDTLPQETEPVDITKPINTEAEDWEYIIEMNKDLRELYGTWTAVIGIVLTLTALVALAFPLYSSKLMDHKIHAAEAEMKRDAEKINKKQIVINNALLLSANHDYFISNQLIEKLIKEYPDDTYLDLLYGRNIFYIFYASEHPWEIKADNITVLEAGVEHYLKVARSESIKQSDYYALGAVFSDSIIHELCMMMGSLLEYSLEHNSQNYHRLAKRVLQAIEDLMDLHSFDAIADADPTDAHIMNYTVLNHQLAKSYESHGNIKALAQYEYVQKLYSISSELQWNTEKEDCLQAVERLKKNRDSRTGKCRCKRKNN